MADAHVHRSQAILRMPVDYVDATLILADGERSEVIFLLSPGDDLPTAITQGDRFLPVMRNARICIIARDAIAAVGVPPRVPSPLEDEMPSEHQRVLLKLKTGIMFEGDLSWTVVAGKQRATDHLNNDSMFVELRTPDRSFFIPKTQILYVQEM